MFDRKIVFSEDDQPVKSIIMVEFKKPMLNNYTMEKNPLLQCFEMVEDVRSSKFLDPTTGRPISVSNRHIPAYCYIICDITESLKRVLKTFQALITPDEQGYYGCGVVGQLSEQIWRLQVPARNSDRQKRSSKSCADA
jgi:hypothetical protein